jgi:serine O-acetyltransferase
LGGTSLYKGAKRHPTLGQDVVIGAGAKVLGGFTVGDGAKVGSNAVVTKPVPAGATAVGNPARIIQEEADVQREATASKMGFSAYGVTQNDDPLSQAMRGLIDNASSQEQQIAMLWQALEKMNANQGQPHGIEMPGHAAKRESFEADKLNQLVGK